MLLPKIGAVPAHPANVHRLLFDEQELVLVFPEGRKGTEKLYKDRYRLRRFGRGGFVEAAMRARAPIVPVALVGAEEAAPIFAQVNVLQKLTGLIYFPITPTFPWLGPLGMLGYLPAKFRIRFLPRSAPTTWATPRGRTRGWCRRWRTTSARRSRTSSSTCSASAAACGSGSGDAGAEPLAPHPRHRPVDVLGRPPRADARARRRRGDRHRHRPAPPTKVELQRTEYVQVADSHSHIRRIVEAAEIDTVVDTRLVVDSVVTTPQRAHENNVIGTMNVLAACAGVRKVIFKSSAHYYGCEQDDPAFFSESMRRPHPARTRLEKDIVEAESAVADFRHRNPDTTVTVLRFANGLGPSVRSSAQGLLTLPVVPGILGFDPRWQFIHEDDMANCLEHAVRHDLDGVFNCAADGVLVLSEVASLLGKPLAPVISPWLTGLSTGFCAARGSRCPGDGAPAALRPRPGQPPLEGDRLPLPLHDARDRAQAARAPAPRAAAQDDGRGLPL